MEGSIHSLPAHFIMMGRVVSMVEAPPQEMAAMGPKKDTMTGVNNKVKSSLKILAMSAIVPRSGPLYCVMKTEERE